ncbi:MAG: Gfo/Idh/MocA family oxidoreductase [Bacteroidales bacterium]|jgi:predicted dehydrogenase|nr:Gfo/Idh/MocA family oxidoreductase [Bacteroidales bacterium]
MERISRRKVLKTAGALAAMYILNPGELLLQASEGLDTSKKIRVGIVGGGFGCMFPWHLHPNVVVTGVTDLRQDRRDRMVKYFKCEKAYDSLEIMLDKSARDFDAIAVFSGAPDHLKHSVMCLEKGLHVICAVPACWTLAECDVLRNAVEKSGKNYMMAETSYYHPALIAARQWYQEGKFGNIFFTEAEYFHAGMEYSLWRDKDGKPTWRFGNPPMHYPTHCTSFLIGLTGERLTEVSCLGWGDGDPIMEGNPGNNPYWNEVALFRTNRGNALRVAMFKRGAFGGCERAQWYGDKMSFFERSPNGLGHFTRTSGQDYEKDGGGYDSKRATKEDWTPPDYARQFLPEALEPAFGKGHAGSEVFLVHEFIESIVRNREPLINVYEALAYTAPGFVAHQSALKGGIQLPVPQFDR